MVQFIPDVSGGSASCPPPQRADWWAEVAVYSPSAYHGPALRGIRSTMKEPHQTISTTVFPVSVIMECSQVRQGRWTVPKWEVIGVVAGRQMATQEIKRTLIRSENDRQQYLWTGLALELFKDAAEAYWFNLSGDKPALYVACSCEDETDEVVPILATADSTEGVMHEEANDIVFSVPMPPDVYQWLERYVVENYVPQEKKKRKRKNWVEDSGYERRPQTTRPRRH